MARDDAVIPSPDGGAGAETRRDPRAEGAAGGAAAGVPASELAADVVDQRTLGAVLRKTTTYLTERGCPSPRTDAEHLLAYTLGLTRIEVYTQLDRPLISTELDTARGLVVRRAAREPLQHIVGEWGFRRLTLKVDPRALIPRPETEIVVDRALAAISTSQQPRVLDVGVGGGAISLAIADEHPDSRVTGVDVSEDALTLAAENAVLCGTEIDLLRLDVLAEPLPVGPWDLVVSNPPYVDPAERTSLEPEVRDHDPEVALFGTDFHEVIARKARDVLAPGGALVFECGSAQGSQLRELLDGLGYREVRVTKDLAGHDRVVEGIR